MLLVLDANFLAHRSKHAMKNQDLSHERQKTEVIFNFMQGLYALAEQFHPRVWAFTWDSRKNFRKKIYPEYKAGRHSSERAQEEIDLDAIAFPQFTLLRKEIIPRLGFINNFIQTGYEGDDIIASIVMDYGGQFGPALMAASDQDLFQLLSYAGMFNPITKRETWKELFEDEKGISPDEWAEVKAIAGCGGGKNKSGDNVNGIEGVGEGRAIQYLNKTLKHTTKAYQNIEAGEKIIDRNRPVVTLPFEGTKTFKLVEHDLHSIDFTNVFEKLGFKSYLKTEIFRQWEEHFGLR